MPFCIIVKYTLNTNNNGTGVNADRLELLTNSQLLIEWLYIEQISWGQMGLHTRIKVSQSPPTQFTNPFLIHGGSQRWKGWLSFIYIHNHIPCFLNEADMSTNILGDAPYCLLWFAFIHTNCRPYINTIQLM